MEQQIPQTHIYMLGQFEKSKRFVLCFVVFVTLSIGHLLSVVWRQMISVRLVLIYFIGALRIHFECSLVYFCARKLTIYFKKGASSTGANNCERRVLERRDDTYVFFLITKDPLAPVFKRLHVMLPNLIWLLLNFTPKYTYCTAFHKKKNQIPPRKLIKVHNM